MLHMPGNDKVIQVRITADRYCTSVKLQSGCVVHIGVYTAMTVTVRHEGQSGIKSFLHTTGKNNKPEP